MNLTEFHGCIVDVDGFRSGDCNQRWSADDGIEQVSFSEMDLPAALTIPEADVYVVAGGLCRAPPGPVPQPGV